MDLARLQELKHKLINEKEFRTVWVYFLDHFGENREFIALGDRVQHPFVETVIEQVVQRTSGPMERVSHLILTSLPEQSFLHGGFRIGPHVGGVFYFEDAQIGLVMVAESPPSIEVKYARFSGRQLRKTPEPSNN